MNIELINKKRDQGKNQKLKLFNLGKAMSGAPIITGTIQLPKPPIKIGVTKKNIIIRACDVTTTLYMCEFPLKKKLPSFISSKRINIDKAKPTIPEKPPNNIYSVPICL
jgi:hypothetical protein